MQNIKLTLQYDGTDFSGYELQPGKRTIRDEIEKALSKIFKKKTSISAVSRTDAGVHALEAVVFFKADSSIPVAKLPAALNALLPEDIRVTGIKWKGRDEGGAAGKEYEYLIYNGEVCPPLIRRFVWHVKPKLDISKMRKAAKYFIGKHDFSSFCAAGGADQNYNKKIHSLGIRHSALGIWGNTKFKVIRIKVIASGFLYKMVRNIVGTLVEVGSGKRKPEEIKSILKAKDRKKAGRTAPPQGLCLVKVGY